MTSPFFGTGTTTPPVINNPANPYNPYGATASINPFVSITPPDYASPKRRKRRGKYVTSLNTDYSEPMVSLHEDYYNTDEIIREVSSYFYYKVLDKWMCKDYVKLFGYFNISGNKVRLISSQDGYKKKQLSSKEMKRIVSYIEDKKIVSKKKIRSMLERYVEKKNINWADLYEKQSKVKSYLKDKIKYLIVDKI